MYKKNLERTFYLNDLSSALSSYEHAIQTWGEHTGRDEVQIVVPFNTGHDRVQRYKRSSMVVLSDGGTILSVTHVSFKS